MQVHRPVRGAAAALVTIAVGLGAATGVAGAQVQDPAAFCAGVAALDDLDAMLTGTDAMGDLATAQQAVDTLAVSLQQLEAVAPAEVADEVAFVSGVFDEFAAEIGAVDPAGTPEEQAAALQAALDTLLGNAAALQAAGVTIDAYVSATCPPVGGVAAGLGGTAGGGSSDPLAGTLAPFAAVAALGAAGTGAAVARRRRPLRLG